MNLSLLSHGPGSSLLEHIRETLAAARTPAERIAAACHDVGKATEEWQRYIASGTGESPHPHAAAGGILAACVLLRQGDPAAALAAMHCLAAHHSYLAPIDADDRRGMEQIAGSPQAREFFLDARQGIASLIPEVAPEVLELAWKDFQTFDLWTFPDPARQCPLNGEAGLSRYLAMRDFLGRLCCTDQASARKQSGRSGDPRTCLDRFLPPLFRARHARIYRNASPLTELRTGLREAFLQTVRRDSVFHFIDAPTGLGKTEAMLRAAEMLREKHHLGRIVYAVPQVSIADQIYDEYFDAGDSAGLWHYLRKELPNGRKPDDDPGGDAEALTAEFLPFDHSYNVTTFNQVLLAMCHPSRLRCIRGLGLSDAVIIFDEFHKLPMPVMPIFFRLARSFSALRHCVFILGSATPLEPLAYWGLEDLNRIAPEVTAPLYKDSRIDGRRRYRFVGEWDMAELQRRIRQFHEEQPRKNLLVVVNLVGKASWPLRREFCGGYFPWRDLEALQDVSSDRKIAVLDGLVPPDLRREMIRACKARMARVPGGLTLIATQMIEVGVDLDFDAALIDYQGLAATVQRGGRIGREGRSQPCPVEVFALRTGEKNTFEILRDVPDRLKDTVMAKAAERQLRFRDGELRFFRNCKPSDWLKDSELMESLASIQRRIFRSSSAEKEAADLAESFLRLPGGDATRLGAALDNAQYAAELFAEEIGEPILVLRDRGEAEALFAQETKILNNCSDREGRAVFFRRVAQSRISLNRAILPELTSLQKVGSLQLPEPLDVFVGET